MVPKWAYKTFKLEETRRPLCHPICEPYFKKKWLSIVNTKQTTKSFCLYLSSSVELWYAIILCTFMISNNKKDYEVTSICRRKTIYLTVKINCTDLSFVIFHVTGIHPVAFSDNTFGMFNHSLLGLPEYGKFLQPCRGSFQTSPEPPSLVSFVWRLHCFWWSLDR